MHNLNDLAIFAAVVTHGGFSAAARALGQPKSSVSRRVAALESRLGVRLLQRSTRAVRVTEVGADFYQHCENVEKAARAAYEVAQRAAERPSGKIRLSSPAGLAGLFLADVLPDFLLAHPQVQVEIELTNRRVDVIREGFDASLRVRSHIDDSELVMRSFGISPQVLVASAGFIAAHGPFDTPGSLAGKPGLGSPGKDGEPASWVLCDAQGIRTTVLYTSCLQVAHGPLLLEAALAGVGIAQLPFNLCHRQLQDGRLVMVLPGYTLPDHHLHMVYPSRRGLAPALRALVTHLSTVLPPQMACMQAMHRELTGRMEQP